MAGTADTVTRRTVAVPVGVAVAVGSAGSAVDGGVGEGRSGLEVAVVGVVAVASCGVAVGAVSVTGWAPGASVFVGGSAGSIVDGGTGWAGVVSAAGVTAGSSVVVAATEGLASVLVSFPTRGGGDVESDEQAISRAAMIQMRAEANLTVRSPRAYYLCLPRAGITPEFHANGGNCLTSSSNWQRRQVGDSEVAGSCAFGFGAFVHAVWTVLVCDVAEAAFRSARHAGGRLVGRQSADQCSQVLYELVIDCLRRYADRVVQVGGLTPEFETPVTLQRSRDGVQVNHHLYDVTGAVLPVLHVDDDRLAVPLRDQVGLARQSC